GGNHYTRLLEHLALARATGDVPLSALLLEESRRFGRHTTVVVVTPSARSDWALTMMALGGRGVKVAAVLIEAQTYGARTPTLEVFGTLTAGGVFAYTLKKHDDIGRVLASG